MDVWLGISNNRFIFNWMNQWINFHHTLRSDSTNRINFFAIVKAKHGGVSKQGQHTLVLETQDRNTCSDGCGTCESHGVNNVQLQTRSWTFRSMNHTQTTWCSCPFSNWIKYRQISFAIRDEPHWHPFSSNRMALGSICEFHFNISKRNSCPTNPHTLPTAYYQLPMHTLVPWMRIAWAAALCSFSL